MTPSVGNAENDTEDVMEGQVLNPESQRGLTLCCQGIKNANYKEVTDTNRKMNIYKFLLWPFRDSFTDW